jgi:hypothetical protein
MDLDNGEFLLILMPKNAIYESIPASMQSLALLSLTALSLSSSLRQPRSAGIWFPVLNKRHIRFICSAMSTRLARLNRDLVLRFSQGFFCSLREFIE